MTTEAVALPPFWRVVVVTLLLLARLVSVAMLGLLLFFDTPISNPLRLMRVFATFAAVPWLASWLIRRAYAADVAIEKGSLVLSQSGQRIEIQGNAIAEVIPWSLPLPGGGVSIRLSSGRRLGLQVPDPAAFIAALADGASADVRAAPPHPSAAYSGAKSTPPRRWYHPLLEFVLFALVPALVFFRLHQWIAYGGTFGEYYQYGLAAYVVSFAIHFGTVLVYLLLYSSALHVVLEPIAFAGAWIAPEQAAFVRRLARIVYRLLYFGGVPVVLALRLLAG